MKAVISNRIILNVTPELAKSLSSALTYRIINSSTIHTGRPTIVKTWARISDSVISIPAGRLDLVPEDYEIIDKRVTVPVELPEFKFALRDSQQAVYDAATELTILNAPVSWGKSFTALAIAKKFSQKTLIVTHNTMLRDQWVAEIQKSFGFTPSVIGSGKVDTSGRIVVANIQTLVKHIDALSSTFGMLILDEAHHCPSTTFSNVVDRCKAKYKLGLTGTLERKDKHHVVFSDYFGFNILKPEAENYMKPEVVIIKSSIVFPERGCYADSVTELETNTPEFLELIASLADSAAAAGHKVLVVGSRTAMLELGPEACKYKSEFITGSIKSLEERNVILAGLTSEYDILWGTISIFSEGISQSDLSCIILASQTNNEPLLRQLIGRIVRLKDGKKQPLIIDINLHGPTAKKQARARLAHYMNSGYRIRTIDK